MEWRRWCQLVVFFFDFLNSTNGNTLNISNPKVTFINYNQESRIEFHVSTPGGGKKNTDISHFLDSGNALSHAAVDQGFKKWR